jgi:hypothetical protein
MFRKMSRKAVSTKRDTVELRFLKKLPSIVLSHRIRLSVKC